MLRVTADSVSSVESKKRSTSRGRRLILMNTPTLFAASAGKCADQASIVRFAAVAGAASRGEGVY